MSDHEVRELERQVLAGDAAALERLKAVWMRIGSGAARRPGPLLWAFSYRTPRMRSDYLDIYSIANTRRDAIAKASGRQLRTLDELVSAGLRLVRVRVIEEPDHALRP